MVEWKYSKGYIDYPDALHWMSTRVEKIHAGKQSECIWLLEHPSLITAGTSAKKSDLLEKQKFLVFTSRRGGQYTYHGPGQRVVYVMLNLSQREKKDIRQFVTMIEQWLINTFAEFNIIVHRYENRIGLWVIKNRKKAKIAAIGLHLRKWISCHGFSININPNLNHFKVIRPCGLDIQEYAVTSLADMGYSITMKDFDIALHNNFNNIF